MRYRQATMRIGILLTSFLATAEQTQQRIVPSHSVIDPLIDSNRAVPSTGVSPPNSPAAFALVSSSSLPCFRVPLFASKSVPSTTSTRSARRPRKRNASHREFALPSTTRMGVIDLSLDNNNDKSSDGRLKGFGNISLWLDMRTAVLPASHILQTLYDDLRQREEALGRIPDDDDWAFRRAPNPVGALLYGEKPEGRAAEEWKALGGGGDGSSGGLRCLVLTSDDKLQYVAINGEDTSVGIGLDPAANGGGQEASVVVAAAVQGAGDIVLLTAVRPSDWTEVDMPNLLRITASACAGSGKTLVVTVRSVGQLHDAAMAALAAAQTKLLGQTGGEGSVALLIEPTVDLWEAGMLYL